MEEAPNPEAVNAYALMQAASSMALSLQEIAAHRHRL